MSKYNPWFANYARDDINIYAWKTNSLGKYKISKPTHFLTVPFWEYPGLWSDHFITLTFLYYIICVYQTLARSREYTIQMQRCENVVCLSFESIMFRCAYWRFFNHQRIICITHETSSWSIFLKWSQLMCRSAHLMMLHMHVLVKRFNLRKVHNNNIISWSSAACYIPDFAASNL